MLPAHLHIDVTSSTITLYLSCLSIPKKNPILTRIDGEKVYQNGGRQEHADRNQNSLHNQNNPLQCFHRFPALPQQASGTRIRATTVHDVVAISELQSVGEQWMRSLPGVTRKFLNNSQMFHT